MPSPPANPTTTTFHGTGTGVDALSGFQTPHQAGRRDGRTATESRALQLTLGVLPAADGSARLRIGTTDVLVAIYGPLDCPVVRQRSEGLQVHVAYRKREGNGGDGNMAGMEAVAARDLRQLVLEVVLAALHPRKAVVVAVQVLADGGGLGMTAMNASVMALVDAGVALGMVPTAACVAVGKGEVVVDPTRVEEGEAEGVLTFAFEADGGEKGFMSVFTEGDCGGEDMFVKAVDTAREIANKTRAFLKLSLQEKASFRYVWNEASLIT